MEDKKQDVKSLEELLKAADEFRKWAVDFGNELSKVLADIQTSKKEEDTWEMKCPYKQGDEYWCIYSYGGIYSSFWSGTWEDKDRFNSGNIFPTKEAAELEAKRRNLLTRFRAFRDECNGKWKADWNTNDAKWSIASDSGKLSPTWSGEFRSFSTFGYFKNREDAECAIELFGEEIKELFMDERLANENN